MTNVIKGGKSIQKEDDCGCGKPLKVNDPRRKNLNVKKTVKKRINLK
jgi:hypothetical protein